MFLLSLFTRHGDDLIVTPFAQVCITLALGLLSFCLWVQFLSVASEPAHSFPFVLTILIIVLIGPRQLAKCEKQLYCTDKPSWSIQQVSMDFLWSYAFHIDKNIEQH